MGILTKFLGSKTSGWLSIIMTLVMAGTGAYLYQQIKSGERARVQADHYRQTIAEQSEVLAQMVEDSQAMSAALKSQDAQTKQLRTNARLRQLAVQEAVKHADKVTRECMSLHLADSLQFGPSRQDPDSEGEARPDVDG